MSEASAASSRMAGQVANYFKPESPSAASSSSGNNLPATSGNSTVAASALDRYRLQLYNYAVAERLRLNAAQHPAAAAAALAFLGGSPASIAYQQPPVGQTNGNSNPAAVAAAALSQLGRSAAAGANGGPSPADLSPFFLTYAAAKFQQQQQQQQQQLQQNTEQAARLLQQQQQHHHHHLSGLRGPQMVEEPKPQHSYIGLIAMAILSSAEKKLVLSDIYQYILDNYAYFRTRGPGWRNSIRHNLSLNDCFIKAGRSANGKGHYWAIHPANIEDFKKGDFRRRKAQRKVRKHMGLAVDEEDSPTPPPSPVTWALTGPAHPHHPVVHPAATDVLLHPHHQRMMEHHHHSLLMMAAAAAVPAIPPQPMMTSPSSSVLPQRRKRLFDVASLLGPEQQEDENSSDAGSNMSHPDESSDNKRVKIEFGDDQEEVDVVSEDSAAEEDIQKKPSPPSPPAVTSPASPILPLWRFSNSIQQQQQQQARSNGHPFIPAAYFHPHPFSANGPTTNSMEQLTKYYEQVAEMMRISRNTPLHPLTDSSSPPSSGSGLTSSKSSFK